MTTSTLAAVAAAAAGPETSGGRAPEPESAVAGVSREDLSSAVQAAEARGRTEGATAERKRLQDILSAEGVAGNTARMAHAMELAAGAPEMTAEAIVELTTKHVKDGATGLSLADRASDADPLGANAGSAAGGAGQQRAGMDVCAIYAKHNGR